MYLADSAVLLSDSAIVTSDRDGNVLVGNVKGALTGAVTGNVTGNLTGTVLTGEQASITTAVNLTTTGALNAGTITSGFGDIDNGTSTINSSGNAQLGKINATDADSTNLNVDANTSTADTFAVNLNVIGHATLDNLTVSGQIYGFTSTATLKTLIAASADFADFQARFARIQD